MKVLSCQGDVEAAKKLAVDSGDALACFHVAKQLEYAEQVLADVLADVLVDDTAWRWPSAVVSRSHAVDSAREMTLCRRLLPSSSSDALASSTTL